MMFLTGTTSIPPLGFGSTMPCIEFKEKHELPSVSTCALALCFSTSFSGSYAEFKDMMNLVILGSQGFFGTV